MHPILARGSRLALYLGVWALVGLPAGGAARRPGRPGRLARRSRSSRSARARRTRSSACRRGTSRAARRSAATGAVRLVGDRAHRRRDFAAPPGWCWRAAGSRCLPARRRARRRRGVRRRCAPLIFGFGVLLYLLSLAVSYLLGGVRTVARGGAARRSRRRCSRAKRSCGRCARRSIRTSSSTACTRSAR